MATPETSIIFSRLSERGENSRGENSTRSCPLSRRSPSTSTFFSQLESTAVAGSSGDSTANTESLASSPVISGDEDCKTYRQAYEKVLKECFDYYTAHPEKDTNGYLNYKNSKIVATTKNRGNTFPTVNFKDTHDTVIEILNEIESKRYPVPSVEEAGEEAGKQDKLLENSPLHLKKVWDASKIVCMRFQHHEKFYRVNKHLQNFAFNYHPKAPMGPEIKDLPSVHRPSTDASIRAFVLDGDGKENTNSPRPGCTIC